MVRRGVTHDLATGQWCDRSGLDRSWFDECWSTGAAADGPAASSGSAVDTAAETAGAAAKHRDTATAKHGDAAAAKQRGTAAAKHQDAAAARHWNTGFSFLASKGGTGTGTGAPCHRDSSKSCNHWQPERPRADTTAPHAANTLKRSAVQPPTAALCAASEHLSS